MNQNKTLPILICIGFFFTIISLTLWSAIFFKKQPSKTTHTYQIPDQSAKPTAFPQTNTPTPKITSTPDPNYQYQNKNNNFNTYFPNSFINTDSNVKFEKKDSSITFSPINARQVSAKNIDGQIVYQKIYQENNNFIDLKYTVNPNQLIEEYIVNQPQSIPKLQQKVKLFNAYPVIKDNKIDFYKPTTDNFLWSIPTPYMYEQNNPDTKNSGIKFSLECEDLKTPLKDCRSFIFTKEITPEGQQWLNDKNRNYPVVIDPFVDGGPCWGIGGYCDSGCTQTAATAITVYTGCSASLCSNTNCWTIGGICDTDCYCSSYSSYTVYTTCTKTSSGCTTPATRYVVGGSTTKWTCGNTTCSADGSGICVSFPSATTYYRASSSCASAPLSCTTGIYKASKVNCTWVGAQYSYSVSGAITKYYGSGSANCVDGSGVCYKLTNGAGYNTGNTGCGSGWCSTGTYYDATQCSWYPGTAGTGMRIEALRIEAVRLN